MTDIKAFQLIVDFSSASDNLIKLQARVLFYLYSSTTGFTGICLGLEKKLFSKQETLKILFSGLEQRITVQSF